MTTLIYRGVTHDGADPKQTRAEQTRTARPRVAQDLIYRGVRHDGLSARAVIAGGGLPMSYRGVRYIAGVHGTQAGIARRADRDGQMARAGAGTGLAD